MVKSRFLSRYSRLSGGKDERREGRKTGKEKEGKKEGKKEGMGVSRILWHLIDMLARAEVQGSSRGPFRVLTGIAQGKRGWPPLVSY